jgi:hypothetical protein
VRLTPGDEAGLMRHKWPRRVSTNVHSTVSTRPGGPAQAVTITVPLLPGWMVSV